MVFPSQLLEDAINEFSKLPGIGKKSALRHVLHLLKQDVTAVQRFAQTVERMRTEIKFCTQCNNLADAHLCNICLNTSRKKNIICVVENFRDLIAIESTQQFNGQYHIIGGLISPLDGVGPDELYFESLLKRVQNNEVEELILALSANLQGDTTCFYMQNILKEFPVKITTISRGVAFGGELEYADEMTLARSIQNRLPISNFVN
jgi:recombination protein RecR